MRAKVIIGVSLVVVVLFGGVLWKRGGVNKTKRLADMVRELGPPTFFAKGSEVVTRRTKSLRIYVPTVDPEQVQDWTAITNVTAIWAKTDYCKRNARYFYDSLNNDKSFHGTGWISSRSPFGEKLIMVNVDSNGIVVKETKMTVGAISVRHIGASLKPVPPFRVRSNSVPAVED